VDSKSLFLLSTLIKSTNWINVSFWLLPISLSSVYDVQSLSVARICPRPPSLCRAVFNEGDWKALLTTFANWEQDSIVISSRFSITAPLLSGWRILKVLPSNGLLLLFSNGFPSSTEDEGNNKSLNTSSPTTSTKDKVKWSLLLYFSSCWLCNRMNTIVPRRPNDSVTLSLLL